MSTSTDTQRAIQITPTSIATEQLILSGGDGIRAAINCRTFDVLSLDHGIDLWVDDEGLLVTEPVLNLPATLLAHAFGVPTAVFGAAVALTYDPVDGASRGLTDAQVIRIRRALQAPDAQVLEAVGQTLSALFAPAR